MLESLMTCSMADEASWAGRGDDVGARILPGFNSSRVTSSFSNPEALRKVLRSEGPGLSVFVIDDPWGDMVL
jgi:hypothetical protein